MRRTTIILSIAVFGLINLPRTGFTHEPVTTKVTFNKEVIRIFQGNCLGCHSPGRIEADIPLTSYEQARPWAKSIKEEILEKRMSPYQAVKGYGNFQHDYILTQRELDLLASWVDGGAPRGEEKDYPKQAIDDLIRVESWQLGAPDLTLQPEGETKIAAKAGGSGEGGADDEVRCFQLPVKSTEDRRINAFEFRPGNGTVVYSASFSIYSPKRQPASRPAATAKKDACEMDGREARLESLGHWIPGQLSYRLPEGSARLLPANSSILMKIRYRKNSWEAADRSQIGLYFAKGPVNKTVRDIVIEPKETTIPAGSDLYRIKASRVINGPAEAIAIRPLLFPFARSVEATAYRPDGTAEVLIWAKSYRFDWQPSYYFKKPISLPKGTRLEITAYIDNSDKNPNHLNDPSKPMKFAGALCEVTVAQMN